MPYIDLAARRACQRRYYQRNKERSYENTKRWREENRERNNELRRLAYARNIEVERERSKLAMRGQRGRKLRVPGHDYRTLEKIEARFAFYGNRCFYCGTEERLTEDHFFAISRGGTDYPANIVPACLSCNSGKRDLSGWEYFERRSQRLQRAA